MTEPFGGHGLVEVAFFIALGLPGFLSLRLAPIWPARDWGCDAYYFLLCREAFRQSPRLPIRLGGLFLCDYEEEWYPPAFIILIAALPNWLIRKYYWATSTAIDACLALPLTVAALYIVGFWPALGMLLFYALSPGLVTEFANLTSRVLAALLFNALLVAAYFSVDGAGWGLLFVAGVLVMALVFTHKLVTQLIWFLFPFLALVLGDPMWLLPLLIGYALAFASMPAMTWKIIRGHYDIVRFWQRHWPDLGKHQVRGSPLYGDVEEQRQGWFRSTSLLKGTLSQIKVLALTNPWAFACLPALVYAGQMPGEAVFALVCALGIYIWAASTALLPFLRMFGEGLKYLKFAEFCALFVVASALVQGGTVALATAIFAIPPALITIRGYVVVYRGYRRGTQHPSAQNTAELAGAFDCLRSLRAPRLLVLPLHLADRTAFETRKPVMWGAHGYGFSNLVGFFPVLTKPLSNFVRKHGLTHALIDTVDIDIERLGLGQCPVLGHSGRYGVFQLSSLE